MHQDRATLNPLEYHVLLALAAGALYGYAIKEAILDESGGSLTPRAGSLYRVLARLVTWRLIEETDAGEQTGPHPGLERKYYALTGEGREALRREAARLRDAAALAHRRLGVADSRR